MTNSMVGTMLALTIRRDRTPAVLRRQAKSETDTRVARRLLAIANALDGMSREDAARSAGMDRQTLRDWVIRYNAHGLDGLTDQPRDGRPSKLGPEEKAALVEIVLAGSDPEVSGISAFTRDDLVAICEDRFGKRLAATSIGRILRELGLSRQKTRPSHPQKLARRQSPHRTRQHHTRVAAALCARTQSRRAPVAAPESALPLAPPPRRLRRHRRRRL